MSEWDLPSGTEKTSIERLGGGFAWESGVFDAKVKMVYLNQADSGAISFNAILENTDGKDLRESLWIRSGNAKGNKTFYTKDGKDYPLPGYSVANSLCVAALGVSLAKAMESADKKTINLYSHADGKEVPTERPVIMALTGKVIKVAVHQITEDKNVKDDTTGQYKPSGKTRTVNECKFFGNTEGQTAEEILSESKAEMFDKWAAKNTGVVIDKTSKPADGAKAGASAADIMGGNGASTETAQGTSGGLFG
jgi:hypothetical protein